MHIHVYPKLNYYSPKSMYLHFPYIPLFIYTKIIFRSSILTSIMDCEED